jgi:ABC-type amino acid transport substrate-binding protein
MRLFSYIFILFFITTFLYAKKVKVVLNHFPPYYIVEDGKKPSGYAVELFENVAKIAGVDYEYIIKKNFKESTDAFNSAEAIILPTTGVSEERKINSIFTSPTEIFAIRGYKRESSTQINSIDSLEKKVIVVVEKNVAQKIVQKAYPKNQIKIVKTNIEAILTLLDGEADVWFYPDTIVDSLLKKENLENQIVTFDKPLKDSIINSCFYH